MLTKPKRPWKNLEEARKQTSLWREKDPTKFPCLACGGRGGYRDTKDLDPIEGYKMAPLYPCKGCGMSGFGSKRDFVAYYKKKIADYKEELAQYKHKLARFQELKKQWSKEDMDILRECLR